MKPATIIGILLIAIGIIGFVTGGIGFTQRKTSSFGPIHVSHNEHRSIPLSPLLSTISLIAGVGLVAVGARSR